MQWLMLAGGGLSAYAQDGAIGLQLLVMSNACLDIG